MNAIATTWGLGPYTWSFSNSTYGITVIKVDIVQTNILALVGSTNNVYYNLTMDSTTNVTWTIEPNLGTNGALFASSSNSVGTTNIWSGTNVWVMPGNTVTSYTLRAYANNFTSCFDTATCVAVNIELEPVTLAPSNGMAFPLYNPSGVVSGQTAKFAIKVEPNTIPDADIVWTNVSGNVSFPSGNSGRLVDVQGTGIGDVKLEVHIKSYYGNKPTVDFKGVTNSHVKITAFIVTDGTNAATTEASVTNLLNGVNDVYKQAGIEFYLAGSVEYITNSDWLDISSATNWQEKNQLCSTTNGTGGIEIYFVETFDTTNNYLGVNLGPGWGAIDGLAVLGSCDISTLSHEIGHAGKLRDIYVVRGGVSLSDDKVNESWAPDDWNNGPGPQYYSNSLAHTNMVKKLMMYGYADVPAPSLDIPKGQIYGINSSANITYTNKVGLIDLQTPKHD